MTDVPPRRAPITVVIDDERLKKAEEFIEEEEGATSRYRGWLGRLDDGAARSLMSLFHLYAAVDIVPAQVLRPVHVGFMLLLVFLLFPIAERYPQPAHVVGRGRARALGVATIAYLLAGGDEFWDRNTLPSTHRRRSSASPSCCSCSRRAAHVGLDHARA